MILQKYEDMKAKMKEQAESKKASEEGEGRRARRAGSSRSGEEPIRSRPRESRTLNSEQMFMTHKFQKFERKLLREYLKTLSDVQSTRSKLNPIDRGHNPISSNVANINTNIPAKENTLLTNLPIMNRKFQERLNIHVSQRNLSINGENSAGDIMNNRQLESISGNIRFLGYDSIFQLTLFIKLVAFMVFFGMNTEKEYRWFMLCFVVSYYFFEVRDIYISHYLVQSRVLNTHGPAPQPMVIGAQGNAIEQEINGAI